MRFSICYLGDMKEVKVACSFWQSANCPFTMSQSVFRQGYRHISQEQIIFFSKRELKTNFKIVQIFGVTVLLIDSLYIMKPNSQCFNLAVLIYKQSYISSIYIYISLTTTISPRTKEGLPLKIKSIFSWNALAALNLLKNSSLASKEDSSLVSILPGHPHALYNNTLPTSQGCVKITLISICESALQPLKTISYVIIREL